MILEKNLPNAIESLLVLGDGVRVGVLAADFSMYCFQYSRQMSTMSSPLMIGHEDAGEDDEVVLDLSFVDAVCKSLADAIAVKVFASEVGGGRIVVRVTRRVAKLAFELSWRSHEEVFTSKRTGWRSTSSSCLTSQLRRWSVKQATPN